ncbi:DUF6194 family protein [Sorangium sp. So ce394]|uniref:DUF6194 family protein n=1 Tax=unclassified Sorangium TaxID=2621164 RepID=UPI003F5B00B7
MDEVAIARYIADTFAGVDVERPEAGGSAPELAWGDTFFIYDPERNLEPKHRFPFATIVTKDYGDFDRASNLDRPGVFRLNIGVGKDTYRALFGAPPPAPGQAGAESLANAGHDFTALDRIMPHPVYAPQSWVCVLNPSDATFEAVRPLLADAYELAVRRRARSRAAEEP